MEYAVPLGVPGRPRGLFFGDAPICGEKPLREYRARTTFPKTSVRRNRALGIEMLIVRDSSQEVQNCCLKIVNVYGVLDDVKSQLSVAPKVIPDLIPPPAHPNGNADG